VLHLSFDEPLDRQHCVPLLIADAWVEYPYSQTAFAAWQANRRFEAATIEARAPGGRWQTVLREFGYPAGMPRQMSVPLSNLPAGATEIRLRTNQEIYWDRLAIGFGEPVSDVRRQELGLEIAELREGRFSPRVVNEQRRPYFDDAQQVLVRNAHDPVGFYTEFGRVEELIRDKDDALAIFGPGEELELAFASPAEPPPSGWSREFVLEVVGWCKDMDMYTANGETVEPIPVRGGTTEARDSLHRKFNTRFQAGR
jgi:hypothetical protein